MASCAVGRYQQLLIVFLPGSVSYINPDGQRTEPGLSTDRLNLTCRRVESTKSLTPRSEDYVNVAVNVFHVSLYFITDDRYFVRQSLKCYFERDEGT